MIRFNPGERVVVHYPDGRVMQLPGGAGSAKGVILKPATRDLLRSGYYVKMDHMLDTAWFCSASILSFTLTQELVNWLKGESDAPL